MMLPGYFSMILGMVMTAFTPSIESEVPYIRMYKPAPGVHMVKINNAPDYEIAPIVTEELTTAKDLYNSESTLRVLVNAGFFDPNNGKTASYVVKNGKIILNPHDNETLMQNEALKPYMDRILNRGEFRVLDCAGKQRFDITYHNETPINGCKIVHSIQAGPILDERMDLEKEYFVVKDKDKIVRDSISATKKVARTAIGLKSNDVYIFIVTDENPMTIEELSAFMKKKGMEKALAFDGGSSTSFENGALSITSVGDNLGRKVKSFLYVR